MQTSTSFTADETAAAPVLAPERRRLSFEMSRLLPFAGLIGLVAFYGVVAGDRFLTSNNLANLVQQAAVVAIIGFGLTFVVVAGSIDLSVGSVAALAGMSGAMVAASHGNLLGILVGLGVGAACGLVNGFVFAYLKVPSFIVTLGMLSVARGLTIVVSGTQSVIVTGTIAQMGTPPVVYVVLVASLVACALLMGGTLLGRYTRAVGGEERVSGLSGVPVRPVKLGVFIISGLMAGLGGLVLSGQLSTATAQAASGLELMAIAAVVLGGTPLTGGVGSVWNTAIGALIIVVLNNGLVILGVAPELQQVIQGGILVLAVFVALDRSKIGIIK